MTHAPLVSVIVPTHNAERTIGEALRSVLDGSFQNFEIIVCDDASTDRTLEVLKSLDDERIRILHNAMNLGAGRTRDRAIAEACGTWIALLDADDAFTPDRLDVLHSVAATRPGTIVFDELMECHDARTGLQPWRPVRTPSAYPGESSTTRQIRMEDWITAPRMVMQPLIPLEIIHRYEVRHGTNAIGEDVTFRCRLLTANDGQLWYVPQPMYLYRITPEGATANSMRHTLLANELERCMPLFVDNPVVTSAITQKVELLHRTAGYQAFFGHVVHGRLFKAAVAAAHSPWVIPELFRRSLERIPYHLSRWRHHGAKRRTS